MSDFSSIAAEKVVVRKQALKRRKAMDEALRIEKSLALVDHAAALPVPENAIVAGFWPIRDEIDPRPLMEHFRRKGHRLCLPAIAEPHLQFRQLERETRLVAAGFGTMEPAEGTEVLRPDVLLMPLAGFDKSGNRLGYGKGYYDTVIAALEKAGPLLCIGVAFDVQEVDRVPVEAHDKSLAGILTEFGYRTFS